MSTSANHHYIPKFILKRFCKKGNNCFYYSKKNKEKGVQERNIEKIFKKRHQYSFINPDGSRDDGLEKAYARDFDDRMSVIIEKANSQIENLEVPKLSSHESDLLIQFIYNFLKRSPDFHEDIIESGTTDDKILQTIEELKNKNRKFSDEDTAKFINSEKLSRWRTNIRISVLSRQAIGVLEIMKSKQICWAFPERNSKSFIIGSKPVIRLSSKRNASLDTEHVQLWAPFGPRLLIGLINVKSSAILVKLSDTQVRKVNKGIFNQSIAVSSISKPLLVSLINSR